MVTETRNAFTGSCHCGNIRYRLFTAHQRDALPLRACRCSFCRQMGARYTSDPEGELRIATANPAAVSRYRFASGVVEFLVCTRCGGMPAAVTEIDNRTHAVVNANTLDTPLGRQLNQEHIAPGKTNVTVTVMDAWECNIAIHDAKVEISNTLPRGSAGHDHFHDDEAGTGRYINVANAPHEIAEDETSLWANSDHHGRVTATYQAGTLGVLENVTATAYNREDGWNYPNDKIQQTTSEELIIRVPDLVHLDRTGVTYTLRGSGSELDLKHNKSAVDRNSHWVTPHVYMKSQQLSDLWSVIDPEGRHLCFNDGSLEFGGTFDNGERPAKDAEPNAEPRNRLHYYHQVGKDVDINRYGCPGFAHFIKFEIDEKGKPTEVALTMDYEGEQQSKQAVLNDLADKLGGVPYPESTIHYRFTD